MTSDLEDLTTWSYRVEKTGVDPERATMGYGNRDLGPEWDYRSVAEEVARENRFAHSYYRDGITVRVWMRGDESARRPQRIGPVPDDAKVFTYPEGLPDSPDPQD